MVVFFSFSRTGRSEPSLSLFPAGVSPCLTEVGLPSTLGEVPSSPDGRAISGLVTMMSIVPQ